MAINPHIIRWDLIKLFESVKKTVLYDRIRVSLRMKQDASFDVEKVVEDKLKQHVANALLDYIIDAGHPVVVSSNGTEETPYDFDLSYKFSVEIFDFRDLADAVEQKVITERQHSPGRYL